MAVDWITIIGFAAGALTTVSFLPQAWKSWKLKETRGVSLSMLIAMDLGLLLWLTYGIMTGSIPIISANAASFLLVTFVLALKLKYG